MAKVIAGGYKYVEEVIEVSDDFLPIITKADNGEDYTGNEYDDLDELQREAARKLGISKCNCIYVGTLDGRTILED